MKIVDIVTNALVGELEQGNIPGFIPYVATPEEEAVLKELDQEGRQRYLKIEDAFHARAAHDCDQYFRAGFAAGLRLAAETFGGVAAIPKK